MPKIYKYCAAAALVVIFVIFAILKNNPDDVSKRNSRTLASVMEPGSKWEGISDNGDKLSYILRFDCDRNPVVKFIFFQFGDPEQNKVEVALTQVAWKDSGDLIGILKVPGAPPQTILFSLSSYTSDAKIAITSLDIGRDSSPISVDMNRIYP